MTVKLLTKQNLEYLSLIGGYTGSSESTLVKMPHCWKSHVTAHIVHSVPLYEHDCVVIPLKAGIMGNISWEHSCKVI